MTAAPDPNGDLVRAMLERRAGRPAPDGVLDRVMRVAATRQQENGRHGRARRHSGPSGSTVLIGALAAAIVGLLAVIVVLVTSPLPGGPAGNAGAGPTAATGDAGSSPAGDADTPGDGASPPGATAAESAPAIELSLAPDRMAVVTKAGRSLRVRSAPSTDAKSEKYEPTLPAGTRMYIVGGPVHADGYTWYQVQVLDEPAPLFGWVATGKDGKAWIKPDRPRCPDRLDVQAFAAMAPLDFLACYGSAGVTLKAILLGIRDGDAVGCPREDPNGACDAEPDWMFRPRTLAYRTADGFESEIEVAVPPALEEQVSAISEGTPIALTVAIDYPDARTCRVMDPDTRADAVPQDQAITQCRATFVVEDIAEAPLEAGT